MIDDKLKYILRGYEISEFGRRAMGDLELTEDKLIAQIKQVFKDEALQKSKEDKNVKVNVYTPEKLGFKPLVNKDGTPKKVAELMTGQEWYKRFEKEAMRIVGWGYGDGQVTRVNILEAAKKAAGI